MYTNSYERCVQIIFLCNAHTCLFLLWLLLLLLLGTCWFRFEHFDPFKWCSKSLFTAALLSGESGFDASSLEVALESVILSVATPLLFRWIAMANKKQTYTSEREEEKTWTETTKIINNMEHLNVALLSNCIMYIMYIIIVNIHPFAHSLRLLCTFWVSHDHHSNFQLMLHNFYTTLYHVCL